MGKGNINKSLYYNVERVVVRYIGNKGILGTQASWSSRALKDEQGLGWRR